MSMLAPLFESRYLFRDQPVAVSPDLRPVWRLSLLALLMTRCCRQGRATLQKLHVLNWALRTPESRQALLEALDDHSAPDANLLRYDPALNKTLDFAQAEQLVHQLNRARFQITSKGILLAEEVEKDPFAFVSERAFLDSVGSRLTETLVERMF
ncbi:hypothetical protein OpiT1DRAFT_03283 [Opitutaceae bacterium TAV1]|nr:hypothetical protein OpiT1DRAFT_03283 [Opitutaceae bacterium TAV1]